MKEDEIELTEKELLYIKSLEGKLNVNEYSELRRIIEKYVQLARNKNWEANREIDRYKSLEERKATIDTRYQEEKTQKEKWQSYYNEVCTKYAKLEIEFDLLKTKVELLEKEEKE